MRVLTVVGTRPEAIKMAPVIKSLELRGDRIVSCVCSTGQHREMLEGIFGRFGITADIELNLMKPNQELNHLTARTLTDFSPVLEDFMPDIVLVQGDTTTAMASALASFYKKIPVGHVEAGLRSFNRYSPFPEEVNRRLITSIATYHFPPTEAAAKQLIQEGIPEANICQTGNTVIDALYMLLEQSSDYDWSLFDDSLRLLLVTAHRRENHGKPLHNICSALKEIVQTHEEVEIAFPVHLNPNVQQVVHSQLEGIPRIHLLPPVPYDVFVHLMQRAYLILTDSGGVQEEAPALGKPVLVLRRETERAEGIKAGVAKLVGTETAAIVHHVGKLLQGEKEYAQMSKSVCPYGDGRASERIVEFILTEMNIKVLSLLSP
ncbi:UDP-N-acetylglucosamine 2-epimerase (non-hydrolyzing) [Candidatus Poribacteria bacterium]|nr:UDP-N-acetylglucosamine 2-epimerase (non-hydrolyzing) [Candidatus Poribacteria bacterium]